MKVLGATICLPFIFQAHNPIFTVLSQYTTKSDVCAKPEVCAEQLKIFLTEKGKMTFSHLGKTKTPLRICYQHDMHLFPFEIVCIWKSLKPKQSEPKWTNRNYVKNFFFN